MKSINSNERKVVNIKTATFTPYDKEATGETGTSYIKLNPDMHRDIGFYIYKMEPGASSTPHKHGGAEEFYVMPPPRRGARRGCSRRSRVRRSPAAR